MKVNLRNIANPYMAFVLIWCIGLFFYSLQWSDTFPSISIGLFFFVIIAIISHYIIGKILFIRSYFEYKTIHRYLNIKYLFVINVILWATMFAYSHKIPLLEISSGVDFGREDFGVPLLNSFTTCFNSFLCIYSFHCYLSSKNRKYIWYSLFCITYFVLIYSRGAIMINLLSSLFLWFSAQRTIVRGKQLIILAFGVITVLYLFGIAGNVRTEQGIARNANQGDFTYKNTTILKIAGGSSSFTQSIIPNEFFWTYVYIASPISNLQYNISRARDRQYTITDFSKLIIGEMWYESIYKRIAESFPEIERKSPDLVIDALNVATVFTRSYMDLGIFGLFLMLIHMLLFPLIYIKILGRKSQYLSVSVAMMCSIYLFSIFDNMFTFMGTGPLLLFPLFFEFRDRFIRAKNTFQ